MTATARPAMCPPPRRSAPQFVLNDTEILALARQACVIEDHYGCPMDMEWARDGKTGTLYIVQARPETVQSRIEVGSIKSYAVADAGKTLVTGLSVGSAAVTGRVCMIESAARYCELSLKGPCWSPRPPTPTGCRS